MTRDDGDLGVEAWAAETFGWERVNGEHYFDLCDRDDRPVEAKGCLRWQSDGYNARRRGRFRLWSESHDRLVNECGTYLFVVYEDEGWEQPWAWRTMDALEVGLLVGQFNNHTFRPSKGETLKVRWPDIIKSNIQS